MSSAQVISSSLWRDRNYVIYWIASICSYAGSRLSYVALPILIYGRSHSGFLTSLVVAMEAASYLVVGLLAGALADRYNRKHVLIVSNSFSALFLATLPLADHFLSLSVIHIFIVAALAGLSNVFFDAADFGALPLLVKPSMLAAATNLLIIPATVIGFAGPAAAGGLIQLFSPTVVIGLDACSFVISAGLFLIISSPLSGERPSARSTRSLSKEVIEGLSYLWRHPNIRSMTLMSLAQCAFGGAVLGQFVPLAASFLGNERATFGAAVLFSAWAAGSVIASLLYSRLARVVSGPWISLLVTPVSAFGGLACALTHSWILLIVIVIPWSVAFSINATNNVVYRMKATPEGMLSRVNTSGRLIAWGGGTFLGGLLGGIVSGFGGPSLAVGLGAVFGALAAMFAWSSNLRRQPFGASAPLPAA